MAGVITPMMVTFVSQCEKKALKRTRRVLDAFADRIGNNTWQTVITEEGLKTVKKMLRQTASKSTAVSCHWIRSRSRTELVWVVGVKSKFNSQGVVPVNYTENEIEQYMDGNRWQTLDIIKYAAAIAGLFHDFGKANLLFQKKLRPKKKGENNKTHESYRHEWVSLRLFQSFIGKQSDQEWLDALSEVEKEQNESCFKDGVDSVEAFDHPISNLPPFAQLVAWLILTHHKLPLVPSWKEGVNHQRLSAAELWFNKGFEPIWNSFNCKESSLDEVKNNWSFDDHGLPYQSKKWRSNACILASEAKVKLKHFEMQDFLNDQIFTSHLARLGLMLADHFYSAQEEVTEEWQSPNYKVYANTDRKTKELKQQLDEHLIGVAYHAKSIIKALPKLNKSLQSLSETPFLINKTPKEFKEKFGWQDEAKNLARQLSEGSVTKGFFGINMASTGKGKTLANAKIMYALGELSGRKRFSVALGLRTLTLQTGQEYRKELELNDEQLAIAVGGTAVKLLFENANQQTNEQHTQSEQCDTGSESAEEYLDSDLFVDYQGDIYQHSLSDWTSRNERIEKLIQAPLLVCTIDHLIPATEGTKGGKQIGPMLRLLTSDLVIDEPDDFGLEDLPALCRLVHWAGTLGSRVLLSTATMPPALTYAAFQAYQAGWEQFAKANIDDWKGKIICAWFDEKNAESEELKEFCDYQTFHEAFVKKRIKHLNNENKTKHLGDILNIEANDNETVISTVAKVVQKSSIKLHRHHSQIINQKSVSIGLVRMANINPLVAVAKELVNLEVPEDTCIHLCVYHSRYPIAIRSYLENKLDHMLKRNPKDGGWPSEEFVTYLDKFEKHNHIFIVLASPVAEVGRDHDYDWAIIEPSSMRSIIQIAGRVLRHRDKTPEYPNIMLLNKNIKCLNGKAICFDRPGFELSKFNLKMNSHELSAILKKEQYQNINSIQRAIEPEGYKEDFADNLVSLEHKALLELLFKNSNAAAKVWWKKQPYWCGEVQKQQRFRDSKKDEALYLMLENGQPKWKWKNENVYPAKFGEVSGSGVTIESIKDFPIANGNYFWFELDVLSIYNQLAQDLGIEPKKVGERFGEVRVVEYGNNNVQEYSYHPNLGLFQEVEK